MVPSFSWLVVVEALLGLVQSVSPNSVLVCLFLKAVDETVVGYCKFIFHQPSGEKFAICVALTYCSSTEGIIVHCRLVQW